jgi:hypothetical protein
VEQRRFRHCLLIMAVPEWDAIVQVADFLSGLMGTVLRTLT